MEQEIHVALKKEIIRVQTNIIDKFQDDNLVNHVSYIVSKSEEAIGELDTQKMINYYNLLKEYQ